MAATGAPRCTRCPKCGHRPLPHDQSLPAACPACGVILAKVGQRLPRAPRVAQAAPHERGGGLAAWLLHVPERIEPWQWWLRAAALGVFTAWGLALIGADHRSGEIAASFLHGPLLIFHEAGHVIFRLFGEWMAVLGGTLMQLLMPAVMAVALLWRNRDPFGAALALWLLGVSLLDVAPYVHDALQPQLLLLNGSVGDAGGHDWIVLLDSIGWRARAPLLGALIHRLGALVLLLALGWAAGLLLLQRRLLGVPGRPEG